MNGGKNKKPQSGGYTIIEVMLFLAISGFMFVMAAIFINGKQANTEFKQGINDANTQIRTVMNDVLNGFYPSASDFECTTSGTGVPTIDKIGTKAQGANLGCSFIGKVMEFGVAGTGNVSDGWTGYSVYSVAGRQYASTDPTCTPQATSSTDTPASFCQAKPVAIDNASVSVTDKKALQWGLSITSICSPAPVAPAKCTSLTPGAIGFFGAFGAFNSSNTLKSGSQEVNVAPIPSSKLGDANEISNIQGLAISGNTLSSPNILLCFQDGSRHKASITIGGPNGQQLSSTIAVGDVRC